MDSDRYEKVCDILNQALDLEPKDRSEFIQRVIPADDSLREEVVSLLAEEEALSDGFLDEPVTYVMGRTKRLINLEKSGPELDLPEQVGPFRILRQLGEGGMGTVVLGEQISPIRRQVALKFIHGMRGPQRRKRFLAECQALAKLNHPNVCSLYKAEVHQDTKLGSIPYVAMEWIDGEPITYWCDQENLTIEDRLWLFVDSCKGVQHAHEKGLLHCDLKPNNILVTKIGEKPTAKIIDFGIAKAIDAGDSNETFLTESGIVGSPAYLSPEAVKFGKNRDLDTRSDVYSLGLILYELLTGFLPFEYSGISIWSQLMRLREEDAPHMTRRWARLPKEVAELAASRRRLNPGQMSKHLKGDLSAIVMKAIQRDREKRYGTPASLAADIRRYLRHMPIEARNPTLGYALQRFIRRHWQGTLMVALVVLALSAGLIARSIEAKRARSEATKAQKALEESEQLSTLLVNLFTAADPDHEEGRELTARELLDKGVITIPEKLADQPLAKARFLHTMGRIYTNLGSLDRASLLIREALNLRETHLHETAVPISDSLNQLGIILRKLNRYDESEDHLKRALSIVEGPPIQDKARLAEVYNSLGNLYWSTSQSKEAEKNHRKALSLRQEINANSSVIGSSLNNLGAVLMKMDRWEEAKQVTQQALEHLVKSAGEKHTNTMAVHHNLALISDKLGETEKAFEYFGTAIKQWTESYGPTHPRTLHCIGGYARMLRNHERWDEAINFLDSRLTQLYKIGAGYQKTQSLRRSLAISLSNVQDFDRAEALFKELLQDDSKHLGPTHTRTLLDEGNLAWLTWKRGELVKAEQEFRRVLEKRLSHSGPNHSNAFWLKNSLGLILIDQGKFDEGERLLRQVLLAKEQRYGPQTLRVADTLVTLSSFLVDQARQEESLPLLNRALTIRQQQLPHNDFRIQRVRALINKARRQATIEQAISSPIQ